MAILCFVKIDGILGESKTRDHRDEIDCLAWEWSLDNTASGGAGGGGGVGKPVAGEFVFQHAYDRASPLIARECIAGRHVREVVVNVRRKGAAQKDYLVVTMKDCIVSAVAPAADPDGILEEVVIAYREIGFAYRPQQPDGSFGPAVGFDWNVATHVVH